MDSLPLMSRFRKKPVVIIAAHYVTNYDSMPDWVRKASCEIFLDSGDRALEIHTLEGKMLCNRGDWVICGAKNEVYPCRRDIFELTYEEVTDYGIL